MTGRDTSLSNLRRIAENQKVHIRKRRNTVYCLGCQDQEWPLDPADKLWWLCPLGCNLSQRAATLILRDPARRPTLVEQAVERIETARRINLSAWEALAEYRRRLTQEDLGALLEWTPDVSIPPSERPGALPT